MAADPSPSRRLDGRTIGIAVCVALLAALIAGLITSAVTGDGKKKTPDATTADANKGNVNLTPATGDVPDGVIAKLSPADASFKLTDFAGKPIVINFFSTTCTPCIVEMPGLETSRKALGSQVTIVGIDVADNAADATKLVKTTKVTYLIGMDPNGDLLRTIGGAALPTTVIADSRGKIVELHTGALSPADLEALLRKHKLLAPAS